MAADDLSAPIVTDRLLLPVVPPDVLHAIVETSDDDAVTWPGVGPVAKELAETMPAFRRLRQADGDPGVLPWLARGMVMADPASPTGVRLVGHIGGHGRPDANEMVEAGYTVAAADRGQGLATEAARAWFGWAHANGARRARLSFVPENAASAAIARHLGFEVCDRVWDEDDEVWEMVSEADLPLGSPPL